MGIRGPHTRVLPPRLDVDADSIANAPPDIALFAV
jgi:hypothetical protein